MAAAILRLLGQGAFITSSLLDYGEFGETKKELLDAGILKTYRGLDVDTRALDSFHYTTTETFVSYDGA